MDGDLVNILTSVTLDFIVLHSKPPSVPALDSMFSKQSTLWTPYVGLVGSIGSQTDFHMALKLSMCSPF